MRPGWQVLNGARIETAWWGDAPADGRAIVLLHEGLGCVALWRDVPERLAAMTGLPVFAYSRLGYGQSDPVTLPRPLTYMQIEARTVLPALLAAEGIFAPVLVGHSDGGSIAAAFAGLVGKGSGDTGRPLSSWPGLSGPSSCTGRSADGRETPGHDGQQRGSLGIRGLITIAAHYFVEDLNIASIRQIRNAYETGDLRQRLARYHRDPDCAFYGWNGAWLDPGFRDFDLTPYLCGITVPTLGLQGADDPYGSDAQLRHMQTHMTAPLTIRLIDGAKHSPHLEAKDATLDAIVRFIGTLPA
jgi:pimeloyl-ACP methyl ester carboxylesterase